MSTVAAPDRAAIASAPALARVSRRRRESPGVWTLELTLEQAQWPGFDPGQFNMLGVFGVGEIPISISGDPAADTGIGHTIRAVGAVSTALTRLAKGSVLGLRGPFGRGWPIEAARGRDIIVMVGGLGLAPVRSLLLTLLRERDAFGRVTLLYGARSPADLLYRREIQQWRSRGRIAVEVTVDHADSNWEGHVGVVTRLVRRAAFDPASTLAYVCGPEAMMRFSAYALEDAGVAATSIHLSTERNMQCAIGHCGHCQLGPLFVCRDGPVFDWNRLKPLMSVAEL